MKRKKWIVAATSLLVAAPVVSLISLTGCEPSTPEVYKVKIDAPAKVTAGADPIQLEVLVDAPDDVSKEVEWTILAGSTGSTLSKTGEFKPGNKTGAVSITATSVANAGKHDTVLIEITDQPIIVEGVTVDGEFSIPAESEPSLYTAIVSGKGDVPQDVTWSVDKGETDASIDENGYLTPGEKQGMIKVIATSVFDPNIDGYMDVQISEPESKLPEIESFEEIYGVDCDVYVCVPSSYGGPYYLQYAEPFPNDVYLFNNSSVPYINVDSYVSYWMAAEWGLHGYTSETHNRKTTITNTFYDDLSVTCTIDYDRQKMIFTDYDKFTNDATEDQDPLTSGAGGGEDYYIDVVSEYKAPTEQYVIDLSDYNINAYYSDGGDGEPDAGGYLPYYVFTNVLEKHPKRNYFFDGFDFYQIPSASSDWSTWDTVLVNDWTFDKSEPIFSEDYMQFCYDLLALTLDVKFGLTERPSRGRPGTTIKYFKNGAYAAMEPYHDALVSLEPNTSNSAIRELFNAECDDGGHAGYSTVNLLSETPLSGEGRGPETSYTSDVATLMASGRAAEGHGLPTGTIGRVEIESSTSGANDIAWVTMDSFRAPTNDLGQLIHINYADVDDTNYMYDTISLTMWLQKTILYNPTITDVVIDLTNNGGGTVFTEHFLASYLCGGRNEYAQEPSEEESIHIKEEKGGVTESIYNPHTNASSQYTVWADINGDGDYTFGDHLPSNIKLWCITSNYSFSCGNMLPCNLADCSDCQFIGDRTGGGACFVDNNVNMAFGNAFRGSSTYHMLKNASTPDNIISVEEGVTPLDKFFIRNTYANMTKFFDRPALIALMKS